MLLKWEYKLAPVTLKVQLERFIAHQEGRKPLIDSIEDALNILGEDGWELVAVETVKLGNRHETYAYLKRPKRESTRVEK